MAEPKKRRSKGKALTTIKTWDDSLSEDDPQGAAVVAFHHAFHDHNIDTLWQEVKHKTHLLVMIVMMIVEGKPSLDELVQIVNFFEDVCTKQKAPLNTLKNKVLSSQNDYICLLKIETFANLNCELTTKSEQLEFKAPSST
jgi:hypothetical protein